MCSRMASLKGIQRWGTAFFAMGLRAPLELPKFLAGRVYEALPRKEPLTIILCMAGSAAAACSARWGAHLIYWPARHGQE